VWADFEGFEGAYGILLCEILSDFAEKVKMKKWIVSLGCIAVVGNLCSRYYLEMPVFNVAGSKMFARYYPKMKVLKRLDL
jgi:hypothetical protein